MKCVELQNLKINLFYQLCLEFRPLKLSILPPQI